MVPAVLGRANSLLDANSPFFDLQRRNEIRVLLRLWNVGNGNVSVRNIVPRNPEIPNVLIRNLSREKVLIRNLELENSNLKPFRLAFTFEIC